MPSFSPSMRDSLQGASFATYVDSLDENVKGNLNPSNPKHSNLINTVIQSIQSGVLDLPRVEKIMRMNPQAAPVFASAYDASQDQRNRKQILGQYFSPAQSELPEQTGYVNLPDGQVMEQPIAGRAATPARADITNAKLAALQSGNTSLAKELSELTSKGESPYAKIDPKDYTTQSLRKYSETGNIYDLTPITKPDDKAEASRFGREDKLRDEFRASSKDFLQVRDSYGRIKESSKNPSAAGDLALIFNYMKMLDPGSTVREGEFATAQNSAGWDDRARAMYNKAINGERLASSTRSDFVSRSKSLYDRQLRSHKQLEREYSGLAKRYNLDPAKVVVPFELEDTTEPVSPQAGFKLIGRKPARK